MVELWQLLEGGKSCWCLIDLRYKLGAWRSWLVAGIAPRAAFGSHRSEHDERGRGSDSLAAALALVVVLVMTGLLRAEGADGPLCGEIDRLWQHSRSLAGGY